MQLYELIQLGLFFVGGAYLLRWVVNYGFYPRRNALEWPLWGNTEALGVVFFWFMLQILGFFCSQTAGADIQQPSVQLLVGTVTGIGVCGFLYFVTRLSGQPLSVVGFRAAAMRNVLVMPLFLVATWGAILLPVMLVWSILLSALGVELLEQEPITKFREFVEAREFSQVAMLLVNAVIVAPIVEEVVFRGAVLGGLLSRWGALPALLVSSLVFGLVHCNMNAFLPLTVLGGVMGYVYLRTASLYPAVIYHALFNLTNLSLVFFTK